VLVFADIRPNTFEQVTNDPHDDRQCDATDNLWKDGISGIVDNFHHTFSLDGPGGPNGIRAPRPG
jgi:hypothetical protein